MRLRTFFADAGDCMLLSAAGGGHILIDGGPSGPRFEERVVPVLEQVREDGGKLDLVIITHIDDDHIDGILHLLKQQKRGKPVPQIVNVWHNSWPAPASPSRPFGVGAQVRPSRFANLRGSIQSIAEGLRYSVKQAREVSEHISKVGQFPINQNAGFNTYPKIFGVRAVRLTSPPHTLRIGSRFEATVLWPDAAAIEKLKTLFDRNDPALRRLQKPKPRLRSAAAQRSDLRTDQDILHGIGDRNKVTIANQASIVVWAEEQQNTGGCRSCLLTGDAAAQDILKGAAAAGKLIDGKLYCDVLKLQHHGASANFTSDFAESVVAEHYVISANGRDSNPEVVVIRDLIDKRAALAPERTFTLWFTCEPARAPKVSREAMSVALDAAIGAVRSVNSVKPGTATVRVLKGCRDYFDICLCEVPGGDGCTCVPPGDATYTPDQLG